jgi:hypothetical protein
MPVVPVMLNTDPVDGGVIVAALAMSEPEETI